MPARCEGSFGVVNNAPNSQTSNGSSNRSLFVSLRSGFETQTMENGVANLCIKLVGLVGPERQRSRSHEVSCTTNAEGQTQQIQSSLRVFELNQLAHHSLSCATKIILDKLICELS